MLLKVCLAEDVTPGPFLLQNEDDQDQGQAPASATYT